jgi:hypothetical protein
MSTCAQGRRAYSEPRGGQIAQRSDWRSRQGNAVGGWVFVAARTRWWNNLSVLWGTVSCHSRSTTDSFASTSAAGGMNNNYEEDFSSEESDTGSSVCLREGEDEADDSGDESANMLARAVANMNMSNGEDVAGDDVPVRRPKAVSLIKPDPAFGSWDVLQVTAAFTRGMRTSVEFFHTRTVVSKKTYN